MPLYGPWTQSADYEVMHVHGKSDSFENRWLGQFQGAASDSRFREVGPKYPISEPDLVQSYDVASGIFNADHSFVSSGVTMSWGYNLTFPSWLSSWNVWITRAQWQIAPQSEGYLYTPLLFEDADPLAIGIEYEGYDFDPEDPWGYVPGIIHGVRLDADTVVRMNVRDGSNLPSGNLANNFETTIKLVPEGGGFAVDIAEIPGLITPGTPHHGHLVEDIDLTERLENFEWTGTIWTETPFLGPFTMDPDEGGGEIKYGWLLHQIVVVWTIRPPLWRWVYSDYGRLKVNVGSQSNPQWKFACPKPGENGGVGVLKVRVGNVWKKASEGLKVRTPEGWKPS